MTVRPISPSKWVWCGYAGHFIFSSRCRLHLHTRVGDYRISTVGAYKQSDNGEYAEFGYQRFGETYVFRVSGEGEHGEGAVSDWSEIDSCGYGLDETTNGTAERGHIEMCRKYARVAVGLEPEGGRP